MTKNFEEKYFDVRTQDRYLNSGEITQKDVEKFNKDLPNDEENFELVMIEEDDIGLGEQLTEEELSAMPNITEDNIDNFDFLDSDIPDTSEEDTSSDENEDDIQDDLVQ